MITAELYRQGRPTVIVERGEDTNSGAWARLQEALARGIESGSQNQTVVHADVFLAELNVLRELKTVLASALSPGRPYQISFAPWLWIEKNVKRLSMPENPTALRWVLGGATAGIGLHANAKGISATKSP